MSDDGAEWLKQRAAWFAAAIGARRRAKQLTQAALAESVGVDLRHLQRLEGGTSLPSFGTILKLALSLDCEPGELFAATDIPARRPGRPPSQPE